MGLVARDGHAVNLNVLARETPIEADAHRALIERAAAAHGIGTTSDLRDYFRLSPEQTRPAIETLVEEGVLVAVDVPGWRGEEHPTRRLT